MPGGGQADAALVGRVAPVFWWGMTAWSYEDGGAKALNLMLKQ